MAMALTIPSAPTRLPFTSPSTTKLPFWSGTCKTASQTPMLSSSLSAAEVVKKFYDSVNAQDLSPLQDLLSDNCVYEDLVYPQPFVGRQAIIDFLQQYVDSLTPDFKFVIDDITDGDPSAVGVVWHVEWKQKRFPFSRGCSFYRCEYVQGKCKIRYGRDCVESAIKPGGANLVQLRTFSAMWSSTSKNYVILFVCSSLFCVARSLSDDITQEITRNANYRSLNELNQKDSSTLQGNLLGLLKSDGSLDIDFIANIADDIDVDDSLSDGQNRSEQEKETAPAPNYSFEYCPTKLTDYIPCLDNVAAISLLPSTDKGEKWERHCPKNNISCLIPPPKDYKTPIRWPKSKDEVWYSNVPHTRLVADKGGQNWIAIKGTKFIFPGGGTQFAHGADQYLDQISQMVPDLAFGTHTHVALDIGCGVASFGAYLLSRNVTTLSVAPKDVHENQIQFALERGVPAMVTVLATRRLLFPSQAFDLIHCSRCRINWTRDDGILLAEVDRVLRAGGYFVWAAQPVYKHEESSMHAWNDMVATTSRLCWNLVAKEGYIAIWQKPLIKTCYFGSQSSEILPLCDEDPNSVWYVPLKACISVTTRSMANIPSWPSRLLLPPQRLQDVNLDSLDAKNEIFIADTRYWYAIVEGYLRGLGLKKEDVRNVMDMNAGLGGFSAAVVSQNVDWWVMNVVPTSALNTLPVIYDRGLVGVIHDWCEAFDTYPRTYDLLHSVGLFAQEERRCNMVQIMLEMDRILRPGGWVLIREKKSIAEKLEQLAKALKWKTRILETESGAFGKDKLLSCQKPS